MELYFDAQRISDPSTTCKGKIKIHELNQDDDELCIEITQEKQDPFVSDVKKIINNQMAEHALKVF